VRLILVIAAAVVPAVAASAAPIISNGSFELGVAPANGQFSTLGTGSTDITDWAVSGGAQAIDYISGYWQAEDGSRSIDMDGTNTLGTISQVVALPQAGSYQISLYMSGNPDGPPTVKEITATVQQGANTYTQTFSYDMSVYNPSLSKTNMNYQLMTWTVPASLAPGSATVSFSGANGTSWGGVIDNVGMTVIPEPTTVTGVMFVAASGMMLRRRRA